MPEVQPIWKAPKPKAKPRRPMRARPSEPLAEWCRARVEGVCTGRAECRHHKLRRSQGGTDDPANTADLCDACHAHVHANPAWSFRHGWLKRKAAA